MLRQIVGPSRRRKYRVEATGRGCRKPTTYHLRQNNVPELTDFACKKNAVSGACQIAVVRACVRGSLLCHSISTAVRGIADFTPRGAIHRIKRAGIYSRKEDLGTQVSSLRRNCMLTKLGVSCCIVHFGRRCTAYAPSFLNPQLGPPNPRIPSLSIPIC
jgi:hypothetical protein